MNDIVINHRASAAPARPNRAAAIAVPLDASPMTAKDKRELAWFSAVLLSLPALMLAGSLALD